MNYNQAIQAMYERSEYNIRRFGCQEFDILIKAMIEELGELTQAHLQNTFDGKPAVRIADEAIDLGALCFQLHGGRFKKRLLEYVSDLFKEPYHSESYDNTNDRYRYLLNKLSILDAMNPEDYTRTMRTAERIVYTCVTLAQLHSKG